MKENYTKFSMCKNVELMGYSKHDYDVIIRPRKRVKANSDFVALVIAVRAKNKKDAIEFTLSMFPSYQANRQLVKIACVRLYQNGGETL